MSTLRKGRAGPPKADILGTPGRAWLSLGALAGSVCAGTLYVSAWRRLLLGFLGPVDLGTVLAAGTALVGAGLGAAAAWRILWRGAVFVPAPRRRPPRTVAAPGEGLHRPPLLSFGLMNLAVALTMLGISGAGRHLLGKVAAWPRGYLLPAPLHLPVRWTVLSVTVLPPMVLAGFAVGLMLHGWGRPRLGRDQSDWYHGVELPSAVLAGMGLGVGLSGGLSAGQVPYRDWVLVAALVALVVAAVTVAASQRFALGEEPVEGRDGRRSRYRWRRFRALALAAGFALGAYAVAAEVLRRRAAGVVESDGLAVTMLTVLAALLAGMLVRRLVRGPEPWEWVEAGYTLVATGCAGLAVLAWLGRRGLVTLAAGEGAGQATAALAAAAAAVPMVGLGWLTGFGLSASPRVGDRHARAAAGLGALSVGAGLGAIAAAAWGVPLLGPGTASVLLMLAAVVCGVVVLAVARPTGRRRSGAAVAGISERAQRTMAIGTAVLAAMALLGAIRGGGLYRRGSSRPAWRRAAVSLRGEVTAHPERTPRLNGRPLPGTEEPAETALLRGLVPMRTGRRAERVLLQAGGDPRLVEGVARASRASPPRLLALAEEIPGVFRAGGSVGSGFSVAAGRSARRPDAWLRELFPSPVTRIRRAAPALPEHLASTRILYDLVIADLRAAREADLVRLAARETLEEVEGHLAESGRAWYWLALERLTPRGLRALLATWTGRAGYTGVWLWDARGARAGGAAEAAGATGAAGKGSVLCALVMMREPFGTLRPSPGDAGRVEPPFDLARRLRLVDEEALPGDRSRAVLTLARPAVRLRASARSPAEGRRLLAENLALLRRACKPLAAVWSRR